MGQSLINTETGSYEKWAQKIAEAIASVLKIDVTIMDDDFMRIAGTGQYKVALGKRIERKTAFDYCLQNGVPYMIERSADHPICVECPQMNDCREEAEICVPIFCRQDVIGVIGMVAFSKGQKETFLADSDTYLNYVQKMAALLGAKYVEIDMADKNALLSKRLETIIGMISEALIVYSIDGKVIYENAALGKLLEEVHFQGKRHFFAKLWQHKTVQRFIASMAESWEMQELLMEENGNHYSFMVSIRRLSGHDDSREMIITLQNFKKIEKKIMQTSAGTQVPFSFDDIIGSSSAIDEVKALARQAATSDSSIFIMGESGTGKEIFARAIHNASKRRYQPFIPINCGAIPDELLESELFGHEKGAFTGAFRTKIGKFEVADNGTIFLDEIGEMPIHLQVKLLRVLQEQEICRIGSNQIKKINIRVISATNQDILQKMKAGTFRADLYYRLNIIPIEIPPLCERKHDILELADYFLTYYAKLLHHDICTLTDDAKSLLCKYHWPGNVRELQNVMEYAVGLNRDGVIDTDTILTRLRIKEEPLSPVQRRAVSSLAVYLDECEASYLCQAVKAWRNGEKTEQDICSELKISRATLYRKLRRHEISINIDTVS